MGTMREAGYTVNDGVGLSRSVTLYVHGSFLWTTGDLSPARENCWLPRELFSKNM